MTLIYFKKKAWHLAAILFSALLLCVVAFYNSFPLTFNHDSGVYINSGFTGEVKEDRPIIYGLFIAFFSFGISLWLIVFIQALITALVVYYVFKYSSTNDAFLFHYIGFIALAALFMGAGFEVAWLMPDVFTAVTILCIALIAFCASLKLRDAVIISMLTILSMSVHNSHFYICILVCALLLAGYLIKPVRLYYREAEVKLKRIVFVIALAAGSTLFSGAVHYHYGGTFKSAHGGVIFFMSNLVEMGVIDSYLNENCEKKHYNLCNYKDSIPNNFLWACNSPLQKTGGWKSNEAEYSKIERDLLTSPRYLGKIIFKSCIYTAKQFLNYDLVHAEKPGSFVKEAVMNHYLHEYIDFLNTRQNSKTLNFDLINYTQHIAVGMGLLFYCLVPFSGNVGRKYLLLIFFLLAATVVNAWVCATFSGVYPRYQTRVAWIIPLPFFLYLLQCKDQPFFSKLGALWGMTGTAKFKQVKL